MSNLGQASTQIKTQKGILLIAKRLNLISPPVQLNGSVDNKQFTSLALPGSDDF